MATGITSWSKTAANNATADSAGPFPEGMAPSAVNDGVRGLMASGAKYRDDVNGSLVTAGTSTAYTVSTNQGFASLAALDGQTITITMDETSGATPTLAVDSLTAKPICHATGETLPTGALLAGSVYRLTYTNSVGEFLIQDQLAVLPDSLVTTAAIADEAVTYAKLQNVSAASRLLGRASSGAGATEEIAVGAGLNIVGTTISSAFPPAAAFKALVIKVTGNTGLTAAADFVTTTDGTTFQTTALSSTINMATTGANALDAGSIASATWYAIWAIAKADGTTAALASTSATSPTMPSGYTFKARIGWVRTAASAAQLLGTWQLGRDAQYIVGLAQTGSSSRLMGTSGTGSFVTIAVGNWVPTTASKINIAFSADNSTSRVSIAPNNSYGPSVSTTQQAPIGGFEQGGGVFILESSNIYATCTVGTGYIFCSGWTDNI